MIAWVVVGLAVADLHLALNESIPSAKAIACVQRHQARHAELCDAKSIGEWFARANRVLDASEAHPLGAYLATIYEPRALMLFVLDVIKGVRKVGGAKKEKKAADWASVAHGAVWHAVGGFSAQASDEQVMQEAMELCGGEYAVKSDAVVAEVCMHGIGHGVMLRKMCVMDGHCLDWMVEYGRGITPLAVKSAEIGCDEAPSRDLAYECQSGVWMTYVDHARIDYVAAFSGAETLVDVSNAAYEICQMALYPHLCLSFVARRGMTLTGRNASRLVEDVACGSRAAYRRGIAAGLCERGFDHSEHFGRGCVHAWAGLVESWSPRECKIDKFDPESAGVVCRWLGDQRYFTGDGVLRTLACFAGMQKHELQITAESYAIVYAEDPAAPARACHRFCDAASQDVDPNFRGVLDMCKNRATCYPLDQWNPLPRGVWLGASPADVLDAALDYDDIARSIPRARPPIPPPPPQETRRPL